MLKKWVLPLAYGVGLFIWVIVMCLSWRSTGTTWGQENGSYMRWIGWVLLLLSPFYLVIGPAAGRLFLSGVRGLKADCPPERRTSRTVALLTAPLVWVVSGGFITLLVQLFANGF